PSHSQARGAHRHSRSAEAPVRRGARALRRSLAGIFRTRDFPIPETTGLCGDGGVGGGSGKRAALFPDLVRLGDETLTRLNGRLSGKDPADRSALTLDPAFVRIAL